MGEGVDGPLVGWMWVQIGGSESTAGVCYIIFSLHFHCFYMTCHPHCIRIYILYFRSHTWASTDLLLPFAFTCKFTTAFTVTFIVPVLYLFSIVIDTCIYIPFIA